MKLFSVLTLLSAAVLLCAAAPNLQLTTCSVPEATQLAVQHINQQQNHKGYKFNLTESKSSRVDVVGGVCNIELQLELGETLCHSVSNKNFNDCEFRDLAGWAVRADCTVLMTITNQETKVTRHECNTRKEPADGSEMMMICPDCPTLLNLNNEAGLKAVHEAVTQFNQNTTNQRLYILQDVGRLRSGYIMTVGMMSYSEFALVETHCPINSTKELKDCKPLCPDRAHHAFCKSSYSQKRGVNRLDCDFFPPKDSTPLAAGQQEADCQLPPSSPSCNGAVIPTDPSIHYICPWPRMMGLPMPPPSF